VKNPNLTVFYGADYISSKSCVNRRKARECPSFEWPISFKACYDLQFGYEW